MKATSEVKLVTGIYFDYLSSVDILLLLREPTVKGEWEMCLVTDNWVIYLSEGVIGDSLGVV